MMRPSASTKTLLGQAHHRLHDVLDHHDGDAAIANGADDRHHVADLRRIEAGQHLVEQQQPRLGRERPREFEPLAAGDREACGRLVEQARSSPTASSDLGGRGERVGARRPRQMRADGDVLAHRQAGKWLHDLEGARDAAPGQPMRRLARDVGAVVDDAASVRRAGSRR